MARLGRDLEQLIERIERALAGTDAQVKSPDYIRDVHTSRLREVDVSVRSTLGSATILVIIECRKRKGRSDVRWIEELRTKRESVGADKIVAVTSQPLTTPALHKAEAYNIEVRLITDPVDKGWFEVSDADVSIYSFGYKACDIGFVPNVAIDNAAVARFLSAVKNDQAFLRRATDGQMLSIDQMWDSVPGDVLRGKVPSEFPFAEGALSLLVEPCQLHADSPLGRVEIRQLRYHSFAKIDRARVPAARSMEYRDAGRLLWNVVEYELEVGGQKEVVTIVHDVQTGKVKPTATSEILLKGVRLVQRGSRDISAP